jgi:hypothetical protein
MVSSIHSTMPQGHDVKIDGKCEENAAHRASDALSLLRMQVIENDSLSTC